MFILMMLFCSEDMLVFLTGQEEIESVARSVREVALDLPQSE